MKTSHWKNKKINLSFIVTKYSKMALLIFLGFFYSLNLSSQTTDVKKKALMEFDKNSQKFLEKGTIIGSSEAFIGDLNADGKKDAVVFYVLSPKEGGNALMGQGAVVYINNGSSLKELTVFKPDFTFHIKEIANNKIHIIKSEYAKKDNPGWPSIETHKYYIINSQNKLQESATY